MDALTILFTTISLIFSILLIYGVIKFSRKVKQFSNDSTVRDVHVIIHDNEVYKNDKNFPTKTDPNNQMTLDLMEETATNQCQDHNGKRKYSRKGFHTLVEIIKEGRLFKETSRDLSYSGIFLKSKIPDQYSIDDIIMLSFQTSKNDPQKYRGQVVRKDSDGIGIKFIH